MARRGRKMSGGRGAEAGLRAMVGAVAVIVGMVLPPSCRLLGR